MLMSPWARGLLHLLAQGGLWVLSLTLCLALALAPLPLIAAPAASASVLPAEVEAALAQAGVPRDALVAVVQELDAEAPSLSWQPDKPVNPASLMKLLTTFAGLELLGPSWAWTTPVWLTGLIRNAGPQGVLDGDLVIKGSGDPTLVLERLWLLLRRVQQLGVQEIRGDIVLDRSAFSLPAPELANFDDEPLRPYNVRADALMLNYKSMLLTFTPDVSRGVATVSADPPLRGVVTDLSTPLSSGRCDDWRAALKADFTDPSRVRFMGNYAASCGERKWPLAFVDAASYNERAVAGLWQSMGGRLKGSVRDGVQPGAVASFEVTSPALSEVVREINKHSNNVMAQQLFLTMALAQRGVGSPEGARAVVGQWATARFGSEVTQGMVVDNGSGLSRENRVSAQLLNRLLQTAWRGPVMPELMASLPVSGQDGTLRRFKASPGRAHLKTGSLRDVAGVAGYVLAQNGRRYGVVAIINHPNANAARPALEALVQWADASTDAAAPKACSPKDACRPRTSRP